MADIVRHFEFNQFEMFQGICLRETANFVLWKWSSYVAQFPDISHIKVNNLKMIEFRFFKAYSSVKQHILIYSNGPGIWHGLPDIRHIKVNYGRWSAISVGQMSYPFTFTHKALKGKFLEMLYYKIVHYL